MHPREMFNRAMVAATVAEAEGFMATSKAFLDMAFAIYDPREFEHAAPKSAAPAETHIEHPA